MPELHLAQQHGKDQPRLRAQTTLLYLTRMLKATKLIARELSGRLVGERTIFIGLADLNKNQCSNTDTYKPNLLSFSVA